MRLWVAILVLAFAVPALWRVRWAYVMFVLLGLVYFPATAGFRVDPQRCDLAFDRPVLIHSLSNYPHIVLFAFFFVLTVRQFRVFGWRCVGWSILITMALGAAIEVAEGLSGLHHCKASDLIPDFVGTILAAIVVTLVVCISRKRRGLDSRGLSNT